MDALKPDHSHPIEPSRVEEFGETDPKQQGGFAMKKRSSAKSRLCSRCVGPKVNVNRRRLREDRKLEIRLQSFPSAFVLGQRHASKVCRGFSGISKHADFSTLSRLKILKDGHTPPGTKHRDIHWKFLFFN